MGQVGLSLEKDRFFTVTNITKLLEKQLTWWFRSPIPLKRSVSGADVALRSAGRCYWNPREKKVRRRLRSGAGNIGDVAVFGKEMQVNKFLHMFPSINPPKQRPRPHMKEHGGQSVNLTSKPGLKTP